MTRPALQPSTWSDLVLRSRTRWSGTGASSARLFFAPGRVNLFGAHLDYNGGPVMPSAIDRGTLLLVRRRKEPGIRLAGTLDPATFDGSLGDLPARPTGQWYDYPLGVLHALRDQLVHAGDEGIEFLFSGDLPVGAGLSSSASIGIVTALALDQLLGLALGRGALVQAALEGERGFVGVQCGIMDPNAIGHAKPGHMLWLDCKDEHLDHVPIPKDRVAFAVIDTGVQRELARGEFNRRVSECASAFDKLAELQPSATCLRDVEAATLEQGKALLTREEHLRASHVIAEVARTFEARSALLEGDLERAGALMTDAHRSLRDRYEVSVPELDVLVEAAVASGAAFGARLTGAGFGGCIVALARVGQETELEAACSGAFEAEFGRRPRFEVFGGDEGPRELTLP